MRILDLYCKAGCGAIGYHRAGFEVVGVDIEPQPHFPFEFIERDALDALRILLNGDCLNGYRLRDFDRIHASPPCQSFTDYRRKGHGVGDGYPNLIPATRALLRRTGLP
jgi:DNA (cytosine-5)-methyltransferase 1